MYLALCRRGGLAALRSAKRVRATRRGAKGEFNTLSRLGKTSMVDERRVMISGGLFDPPWARELADAITRHEVYPDVYAERAVLCATFLLSRK